MARGKFITFEGIEGSGKSTQVQHLAVSLREAGRSVVVTREPGGANVPVSESVRRILLESESLDPRTELFLFLASRAEHVTHTIAPALERGAIVLCDRFADASVAYQGYGRGLDPQEVKRLNRMAVGGVWPDLTILLDLDEAEGLSRAGVRAGLDRIERESLGFHRRVREGYLAMAASDADRIHTVDAARPVDEIRLDIGRIVSTALAIK